MSQDPCILVGFDAAGDGTFLVVMSRQPGSPWRIISADGPGWTTHQVRQMVGEAFGAPVAPLKA